MENWRKSIKEQFNIGQQIGSELAGGSQMDKIQKHYKEYLTNIKRHINFSDNALNIIEDLVDNISGQPPGNTQMKMPRGMKSVSEVYDYFGKRIEKLDRIKSKLRELQNK